MEKRGKEVILLVLAVLLAVVAGSFLMKRSKTDRTAAPPPPPKQTEKQAQKPEGPELPTPQSLLGESTGNSASRNPFNQPGGGGSVAVTPSQTDNNDGSEAGVDGTDGGPDMAQMPGEFNGFDVLRLTGLIRGKNSLAIIRKGETRYFVGHGEQVEGNYVVASIGSSSVTLRNSEGNKIILHLGGGR